MVANNSLRGTSLKNRTSFQAEITAIYFISTFFHFFIADISFYFYNDQEISKFSFISFRW